MLLLSASTCSQNSDEIDYTAQTKLRFRYSNSSPVLDETRVSIYLRYSNNKIALLDDTIRDFQNNLYIPSKVIDYTLSVTFENKIIGEVALNYPFTLSGTEANIDINVRFWLDNSNKKGYGFIEVVRYYDSYRNLYIRHLSDMEGNEHFREPFFLLKNNSNDTIRGQYLDGYFWGSLSVLLPDSIWSRDMFGRLDLDFAPRLPLFPDSTTIASVGSFGWRNVLPKNRYRYTLLYRTNRSLNSRIRQSFEKDSFTWQTDTRKFYRLIYEFEIE